MRSLRHLLALLWGALIAVLGGLIGLGGAEFRLPDLVGVFRFRTLQAIVINLLTAALYRAEMRTRLATWVEVRCVQMAA